MGCVVVKRSALTIPLFLFATACSEHSSSGVGPNSSGGTASGFIRERADGSYTLAITADGAFCSAIYTDAESNGSELRALSCTGGQGGNATLLYDGDGAPKSATYGGLEIGSGTVRF